MSILAIQAAVISVLLQAGEGSPPPRLPRVAVLLFQNRTPDARNGHWVSLIHNVLLDSLRERKRATVLRGSSVQRAEEMSGISGSNVEPEQARRMGELLQAQRIVWGTYTFDETWRLEATVLHVASGELTRTVVEQPDIFDACHKLALRITADLVVSSVARLPDEPRRWTTSPKALESFASYYHAKSSGEPSSVVEGHLRSALAMDPRFAMARGALAALLASQGKLVDAEEEIQRALQIEPTYPPYHQILGSICLMDLKLDKAKEALEHALRLDPDELLATTRLPELYLTRSDLGTALDYLRKAINLDPFNPSIHAKIARIHALRHDRAEALRAMEDAERYYTPNATNAQFMFLAYAALGHAAALKYHDEFAGLARSKGLNPTAVEALAREAARLASRFSPFGIASDPPKTYTPETFEATLRSVSGDPDIASRSTLESSGELGAWARGITNGSATDIDKAQALFNAMMARPRATGRRPLRTALEAFEAWNVENEEFACQDYSRLYVAAARAVGLQAFLVFVEQDCFGSFVTHACAGVFVGGKLYLVDVTYRWFDVSHKSYSVLDDVQALGLFLCQMQGDRRSVQKCTVGFKLYPSAYSMFSVVAALIDEKRLDEAHSKIQELSKVYPGHWYVNVCSGTVAYERGDKEKALASFRAALSQNVKNGELHWLMGRVLLERGEVAEALNALNECLRYNPHPVIADSCRKAIAWILESETAQSKGSGEFQEIKRAIESLKKLRLQ